MERQPLSEEELDHLLSRISRTQPVDPSVAGDERVCTALADMRRDIESAWPASSSLGRHTPPRDPRRRHADRRRWVTVGAAVATAGVASLVGVESFGGSGAGAGLSLPLAVSPAAAAHLNRAARAAAETPTPGDGQWRYQDVRVENTQHITLPGGPTIAYTIVNTQQTWYSPSSNDSRELDTQDGITFPTAHDKATYLANQSAFDAAIAAKYPQYPPTKVGLQLDETHKGSGSPQPWQASPPSDPQTLLSELWKNDLASQGIKLSALSEGALKSVLATKGDDMWMALGDLLDSPTAKLRATAFAALSYVPGNKVDGNATDELGRSGIAVSWMPPAPGNGLRYIISPTTGNLLETDLIQGHTYGGDKAGSAVMRSVYLRSGVVDSNTALPGGGTQPIAHPTKTTTTPTRTTTAPATRTTATTSQG